VQRELGGGRLRVVFIAAQQVVRERGHDVDGAAAEAIS
jgi:hypothetical protein